MDTRPELWAEPGSLQDPWAQLELLCRAREPSGSFQLFKDGSAQEPVRLDVPALERRFPLGAVTAATRGLYRCRCRLSENWSELSDLVEVSGPGECGAGVPGDARVGATGAPTLLRARPCLGVPGLRSPAPAPC